MRTISILLAFLITFSFINAKTTDGDFAGVTTYNKAQKTPKPTFYLLTNNKRVEEMEWSSNTGDRASLLFENNKIELAKDTEFNTITVKDHTNKNNAILSLNAYNQGKVRFENGNQYKWKKISKQDETYGFVNSNGEIILKFENDVINHTIKISAPENNVANDELEMLISLGWFDLLHKYLHTIDYNEGLFSQKS